MVACMLVVAALVRVQVDDRAGPLKYVDAEQRFTLAVPGTWVKDEPPEFPCQAMFLEITQGAFVSVHVRKVPMATELAAAVAGDAVHWSKQRQWQLLQEEAKSEGGVSLLVQKATFVLVDEESPEDAEPAAIRLVHAVFKDVHVTIGIVGDTDSLAVLDQITQRVVKGLRPPSKTAAAAPGHDESKAAADDQPAPAMIDPRQLDQLDPETRAAVLRLLDQQKQADRHDVDEVEHPAPAQAAPPGATALEPFPAWFVIPAGWRIADRAADVITLVSDTEPGLIAVHAGLYASFDGMYLDLNKGFQQQRLSGQALEGPRPEAIADLPGTFAAYQGQAQDGTPIAARFRAVRSAHPGLGVGIMVCGLTTPQMMSVQGARIDAIARSFRVGEFAPERTAMAALVGDWALARSGSSGSLSSPAGGTSHGSFASYSFRADGSYSYAFESSLSVAGGATSSGTQATVFSAANDHDEGRFYVAKDRLVLASSQGGCVTYDLGRQGNQIVIGGTAYSR
ncbi:MAG: hypothetical protein U1E76_17650 [Planctomycetota bacterium]